MKRSSIAVALVFLSSLGTANAQPGPGDAASSHTAQHKAAKEDKKADLAVARSSTDAPQNTAASLLEHGYLHAGFKRYRTELLSAPGRPAQGRRAIRLRRRSVQPRHHAHVALHPAPAHDRSGERRAVGGEDRAAEAEGRGRARGSRGRPCGGPTLAGKVSLAGGLRDGRGIERVDRRHVPQNSRPAQPARHPYGEHLGSDRRAVHRRRRLSHQRTHRNVREQLVRHGADRRCRSERLRERHARNGQRRVSRRDPQVLRACRSQSARASRSRRGARVSEVAARPVRLRAAGRFHVCRPGTSRLGRPRPQPEHRGGLFRRTRERPGRAGLRGSRCGERVHRRRCRPRDGRQDPGASRDVEHDGHAAAACGDGRAADARSDEAARGHPVGHRALRQDHVVARQRYRRAGCDGRRRRRPRGVRAS